MPQDSEQEAVDHGKNLASWKFDMATGGNRGRLWYFMATIIFIGLLAFSIATLNFLFGIIIVLFALVMFVSARAKKEVEFKIFQDGLQIGSKFMPFRDIEKFWIIYQPPDVKNLYFTTKGVFSSHWFVPLEDQNPVKIRKIFLKYLPEDLEQEEEPFTDQISRIFKL